MRRLLSTLLLALLAVTSASAQPAVGLDLVADGFTHPLALAAPPDERTTLALPENAPSQTALAPRLFTRYTSAPFSTSSATSSG